MLGALVRDIAPLLPRRDRGRSAVVGVTGPWPALWLGLLVVACDGGADSTQRQQVAQGTATVGGSIVSTVAGEPITLTEVRKLRDETGLPAAEVLRRLQDRILLMREAEARGLTGGSEGARVARKAAVQRLLAERIEAQTIPEEELREAYDQQRSRRFDLGERRAAVHILAKLPAGATPAQRSRAWALAERAIALLQREPKLRRVKRELGEWDQEHTQVRVEALPALPRNGTLVRPFEDALFSLPEPGVVAEPVETEFGIHAVRVTQILPPRLTSYEEAREILRQEAQEAQRERAMDALLRELERAQPVERDERVIGQLGQIAL